MNTQSVPISAAPSNGVVKGGFRLSARAFYELLAHDIFVRRNPSFSALHELVRTAPVRPSEPPPDAIERVKAAIDEACVWYPRRAVCLQRSVVAVMLLRRLGVHAQLVYGVQQLPFKAHAWVEVAGSVVNDRPEVRQEYCVMERI